MVSIVRFAIPIGVAISLTALLPLAIAEPPRAASYIVGFRELPDSARRGVYAGENVTLADSALRFVVVQARNPAAFERAASRDPNVRYVALDRADAMAPSAIPNDPSYAKQWAWARVKAPAAWDVTTGNRDVVVAVLDTGVERSHPDLAGARMLPGWDFVNKDADPNDDCGHGTHVAGIVGATSGNALGVAGAAQVSILPVKVMGRLSTGSCAGPYSAIASGIVWAADQGADVITMSLGCRGCYDQATTDALEYAWSKGVVLVASVGNNGPCTECVTFPATNARVIAVGCTDATDAQCYFSNSGAKVEIVAPGKSITSTFTGSAYATMSGTSMAAPHVAGAAALALSVAPALTNQQVRDMLGATARDLAAAGRDAGTGYGLVDYAALVAAAKIALPPPNAPPTAGFTVATDGLAVTVSAAPSSDADGTIVGWQWTWGDGLSFGGLADATHAYAADGTFAITLTVTDDDGATASATRTATVAAPAPPPPPAPSNTAPTASFTTTTSGLTASADASASTDADGTLAAYAWAWGDGATATGASATHAYAAAGTYTIALTVTDDKGATATTERAVTVAAPPPPGPATHVSQIASAVSVGTTTERLTWAVTIVDAAGARVASATVTSTVQGPDGTRTMSATTDVNGVARIRLDVPKTGGVTYTLTVTGAAKSGTTYNAAANVETSEALTTL